MGARTAPLGAQSFGVRTLTLIGSEADERARLSQLLGDDSTSAYLLRSASTFAVPRAGSRPGGAGFALALLAPEAHSVSNSALPYSLNDGAMWAGRGLNTLFTAGIDVRVRALRVVIAPQFTTSANLPFQVIATSQESLNPRNVWANPFHPAESSIDLPLRFGDRKLRRADAGQSSVTYDAPGVSVGVGTENLWWGPGIENAIVLSNNASGFPHAFLRTRNPVATRIGRFDAEWILGRLDESDFFDSSSANNVRSLSGLVVVYTPSFARSLNLGIARTVFAPSARNVSLLAAFDVLKSVGNPNTSATDIARGPGPDQLTTLFARYLVPRAHVETYAEWARFEQPISLRDFVEYPGHSNGYTLGLQWARPTARTLTLRLSGEVTYLEPDASIRLRPVATSYTSRSVVQGYTNRGQALGASIGPGSSSQWLSADIFGARFRAGVFASRIRWDNATLWLPIVPQVKNEDVSVLGGLRASATVRGSRLSLEYTRAVRLDYLYQDKIADLATGRHAGVDILNRTVSVTLSTAVGRSLPVPVRAN